jgi:hypothetical protein
MVFGEVLYIRPCVYVSYTRGVKSSQTQQYKTKKKRFKSEDKGLIAHNIKNSYRVVGVKGLLYILLLW